MFCFVYDVTVVPQQYSTVLTAAATAGRSEGVTSLDWSADGTLIRMGKYSNNHNISTR
jgi:hypothetical protein